AALRPCTTLFRSWNSGPEPGSGPLFSCPDSAAQPLRRAIAGRPFAGRLLPVADRRLPVAGRPNASFNATRTYHKAHSPTPVIKATDPSTTDPPFVMCI